jgi:hypothetical protein
MRRRAAILSIPSAALRDSAMEDDPCCMTIGRNAPVHTGLEVLVWRPILSAADLDRTLDFIANVLRSGLATPAIPGTEGLSRYPAPLHNRMIEIGWLAPTSRVSSECAVGAS